MNETVVTFLGIVFITLIVLAVVFRSDIKRRLVKRWRIVIVPARSVLYLPEPNKDFLVDGWVHEKGSKLIFGPPPETEPLPWRRANTLANPLKGNREREVWSDGWQDGYETGRVSTRRVVEACAELLLEHESGMPMSLQNREGWRLAVAKLRELGTERLSENAEPNP